MQRVISVEKLSGRQEEVLAALKDMTKEKGYPPTVRELGERVGLKSTSTVSGYLERLESKGYIKRSPSSPRAIEIIKEVG